MAHNCPDCYALCYCGGDIDDIQWDDDSEEAIHCTHWHQCERDYEEEELSEDCDDD